MIALLFALALLVFLLLGGITRARAWVVPLSVDQLEDGTVVQYFKQRTVYNQPDGSRRVVYLPRGEKR